MKLAAGGAGDGVLFGIYEANETYIGGKEANKHDRKKNKAGRWTVGKTAVLGIRQRGGTVKVQVVKSIATGNIQTVVKATVVAGATLCTDEYADCGMNEYDHRAVNHSVKQFVDGIAHTNGIESVWSVLKHVFCRVYHQFSTKHMQRYVDELSSCLNEENGVIHTLDRIDSLLAKSQSVRFTYANFTGAA